MKKTYVPLPEAANCPILVQIDVDRAAGRHAKSIGKLKAMAKSDGENLDGDGVTILQ